MVQPSNYGLFAIYEFLRLPVHPAKCLTCFQEQGLSENKKEREILSGASLPESLLPIASRHAAHGDAISTSKFFLTIHAHLSHSSIVIQGISVNCRSCLSFVKKTSQPRTHADANCRASIPLKSLYLARINAAILAVSISIG